MIPVNVVTGFLGSGKTTLLRAILADPAFADTAVIVNELGEVGLDHLLLEVVDEGVLLLDSGCICCTLRADLKETIRDLHDRAARKQIAPFQRIVVETTGLADPAPIVSTLAAEPVIRKHFALGNIVCTVDALAGDATLTRHDEATKQVAVADRLLITKADLADPAATRRLAGRLTALNPTAPVDEGRGAAFDADLLFGRDLNDPARREGEVARWLEIPAPSHDEAAHDHIAGTCVFTVTYAVPIDWIAFGVWLTALLHAHGDRILRVKGVLNVRDSATPVVLHGVQHVVHPPLHLTRWPPGERSSRIVFITRGIEEQAISDSLSRFMRAVAGPDARSR